MHNSYQALLYETSDRSSDQVAVCDESGSRTVNVHAVGRIPPNDSTSVGRVTKSKLKKARVSTPVRSNDDFPAMSILPASENSQGVTPIVNHLKLKPTHALSAAIP